MQQIRVYTTNYCPFCDQAKILLKKLNLNFEEIRLDQDFKLREQLSRDNNGWRTVPMIFVGDEFIGGFNELAKLHREGRLTTLVEP